MDFYKVTTLLLGLCSMLCFVGCKENTLKGPCTDCYQLHEACTAYIQAQVNEEMRASLVYMNMAGHFDKNSIARKGFARLFKKSSWEEKEHAEKLISYLNKRGSEMDVLNVTMPKQATWSNARFALEDAIALEMELNDKLHALHSNAEKKCKDAHLTHFLEEHYLEEQVQSIDKLTRYKSILIAMVGGMGEYLLDRELQEEYSEM
ncbi:ferritin-1 heavy chain-like [Centruroides sculpturatus]|uniref:ferritin-1 heavy chain-like n=1 Tax=Centruroides sculpturatus TaxID=218467 RepID=UPI000C6D9FB5|nr:ferritin-1 heavy chain-like [Centruroides sculpturatus]